MTNNRFDMTGDYVEEVMASWQIPGLALAIVKGDEVLHMQGYGVRDVETREPITPDTIFPIASSTKAFTAMGIALLVDEGKVEWDKPVRNYLPDFELSDGYVSEKLTVRDLLCHRSGLPRHDLAWYGTTASRADLIRKLKYLEFSKGFREVWQYQNLMYVTAGYLAGQMTGLTWEDYTQQRIFDPLKMSRSCFSPDVMRQLGSYAMPYRIKRGKAEGKEDVLEVMEFYSDPVMGPAGSIHSNVQDLAKWLEVHLNEGQFEGQPFVSPGSVAQMHQPQMIIPVDGFMAALLGTTISTYGLGWFVVPYRGHTLIHHGGNIDGFSTMVAFVPRENIGIVVLTNIEGRPLRDILTYEICDRLLDLPENQWNQRFHAMYDELYASIDRDRDVAVEEQKQDAPLSHPIEAYVGEYAADGYGDFVVKLEGEALLGWVAGDWFPLQHYHYDIFNLDLDRFEMRLPAIFQMNSQGEIDAVSLQLEPQVEPRLFKRKPIVLGDEVLAELTGRYDLPIEGMELAVTVRNNRLFMTATGQAGEELLPYRVLDSEVEFLIKNAPGVRLEFQKDAQGVYRTALLKQPGQVFEAPRVSAS
jgi:CubicO group peptidase (beta-lactamase class C family)